MRSQRLPADLSLNATTRALRELRRRGVAINDLTVSNPTVVGFDYPADLLAALSSPAALAYDPQPLGLDAARQAVVAEFARRGRPVAVDRIALTASTSEAYSLLFKLVCDAGDSVLVPQPSYPLFAHLTTLEAVEARPYRMEYHGAWRIDSEQMAAAIDHRTRAVLIVSPNNPTGAFVDRQDLDAVARLCAKHQLLLIGDEVFADYDFEPSARRRSVLDADVPAACSLGGLSKSVGLPQLKLGWMAFHGDGATVDGLLAGLEVVADTYLSVSTPVQTALPELLQRGAEIRRQISRRTARNLTALRSALANTLEVSLLEPEGGWSAVLQVPAYRSEEALVLDLLNDDQVLVHPGFFFDFERGAHLVVSLLAQPAQFDRGIARLLARASSPGAAA